MKQLIDKSTLVAEIEGLMSHFKACQTLNSYEDGLKEGRLIGYEDALYKINALEVKESDETAEAFARIIRANLTGIDRDVQYKFEQLYKEITGEKMYQGFKD